MSSLTTTASLLLRRSAPSGRHNIGSGYGNSVRIEKNTMRIMVFLHGTAIMHRKGLGCTREERVKQVLTGEKSVYDFEAYVPVGNVVQKLHKWKDHEAKIEYLSSHTKAENVEKDERVLKEYGFPEGKIHFRQCGEEYQDIVERVLPDILIEDDCESIGGEAEMTYPQIEADLRKTIKSIVVKEFGGIDHLPDSISDLACYDG